ncbi:MAG: trypsin-like serine protease [Pirellulales bacterium]
MKASCVLIAPEWAVTAAHVVQGKDWMAVEDYRFVFGGQSFHAARVVIHPDVNRKMGAVTKGLARIASGVDLALVKLTKPIHNVRPAVRYRGRAEIGKVITKVGHGMVGDGMAGIDQPFVQERRGGNNRIDAVGGVFGDLAVSDRVLLADFDSPVDSESSRLGDSKPLEFEIGFSRGDSGGGWFIQDDSDGGAWKLVAVTSGWVPPDGNPYDTENNTDAYGTIGAGMRISALNSWIDGAIDTPSAESRPTEESISRDGPVCR